MFRRRGVDRRYTPQQTIHWLTWLAWQMVRHSQTVFYIERLQPNWLPREQRGAFGPVLNLIGGLVVGLVNGLSKLIHDPLVVGQGNALVVGLRALVVGLRAAGRRASLRVGRRAGLRAGLRAGRRAVTLVTRGYHMC